MICGVVATSISGCGVCTVCCVACDWIHIIPTHDMHQWLLLQFLAFLMMGRVILQLLINNTAKVASCWFFIQVFNSYLDKFQTSEVKK